jgi:hypothetical protein
MTPDQETVERTFVFKFPTCTTKQEYKLEVPIYVPYSGSIKELSQRLISSFKLPCYVEKGRLYLLLSVSMMLLVLILKHVLQRASV